MITPPEPKLLVSLKVRPNGRAPAKYGSDVYKFSKPTARLLKSRNWREVGHNATCIYLTYSGNNPETPPFVIDVKIPTQDQALALAHQLDEAGKAWDGRFGEWDAGYRPVEELSLKTQRMDPFTATPIGSPVHRKSSTLVPFFMVGSPGLWLMEIRLWSDGPICEEDTSHVIIREATLFEPPGVSPKTVADKLVPDDLQIPEPKVQVSGGGFADSETRKEVEVAAIAFVISELERRGFQVQDQQCENCGYDLLAVSPSGRLLVEVKGTDCMEPRFFLTRNECRCSENEEEWRLFVVCNARSAPVLHEYTAVEMCGQFKLDPLAWECTPSR